MGSGGALVSEAKNQHMETVRDEERISKTEKNDAKWYCSAKTHSVPNVDWVTFGNVLFDYVRADFYKLCCQSND